MEKLEKIAVRTFETNPFQPRKVFDQEKLEELAQSIKENGLIQPIIVRKSPIIGFELLAGERRFRASKIAGLDLVPAIIKELTDQEMMRQAIIENLQREDLNQLKKLSPTRSSLIMAISTTKSLNLWGNLDPISTICFACYI